MPLGHRKLSRWYHQLGQQLEAGVPLVEALRLSKGIGPPGQPLEWMALQIEAGGSVADALSKSGPWLPAADRLALSAAASAGRMPLILHTLSERHAQLGKAKLKLALACLYPLGILHLGFLLIPVVRMIDWEKGLHWDATVYVRGVAMMLVPCWVLGSALWILIRRGNRFVFWVARFLPAIGGYIRTQELADFAFVLGNLIEAGVGIGPAWGGASSIVRGPELQTAAAAMQAVISRGEPPGPRMVAFRCFPADFAAQYRTGEATGHLDTNLLRLATQYQ
ncbi:MAG TPA: type II secretion system F family protein, partial [Opitutaceae bacterium]|nr:type II secretion system F family protein [Opitutaceae bacterium]